jgi:acyl-CoA synthetase (AMP-forming)/AMP-acid ligase II
MIPPLLDHIRFQARVRPGALAVFGSAGPVAYQTLVHDIDALATELLERNLTRQDMVGIQLGFSYLHLLLILALDRLSIPSMSFQTQDKLPPARFVREQLGVTAVISTHVAPAEPPSRWIEMAEQHRPRFGAVDAARLGRIDSPADGLVHVSWSSGTTGGAKGVPILRSVQAFRLASRRRARNLGSRTRYFTAMPHASVPGYIMPLAVLSAGGAVILPDPGTDFVGLTNALGVTATSVAPSMLVDLIGKAGAVTTRLEAMELLMVSGGPLPSQLAQEARLALTPHIWIGYGATETDGVAMAEAAVSSDDPSVIGFPFPWVDAQIVDAADRPLPAGQEGLLRLRSAQTVAGYYKNAAATQRNFRDGWFYPGDVGALTKQGLLRITGRVEDVIVRDGVAISPLPIEEAIGGLPQVREVAVFPMQGTGGPPEIWAAVVLEPGCDPKAVAAAAAARLGDRTVARLFLVDRLPRNANGKVLRRVLVEWAGQSKTL